jgi:hypothetical protein
MRITGTHATKPEFMQLARRDWANVFARLAVVQSDMIRRVIAVVARTPPWWTLFDP